MLSWQHQQRERKIITTAVTAKAKKEGVQSFWYFPEEERL